MRTCTKIAAFVAAPAVGFAIMVGVGNVVGPFSDPAETHDSAHDTRDA